MTTIFLRPVGTLLIGAALGSCALLFDAGQSGQALDGGSADAGPQSMGITLLPGEIDFDKVVVDSQSASFQFTAVATNQTSPLQTGISGSAAAAFEITQNDCAALELGEGETCTMAVRFAPKSAGVLEARLAVGEGSALVKGTGLQAGSAVVAPSSVDFGSVKVNSASPPVNLEVVNQGNVPIAPTFELANAHFQLDSSACDELEPQETCMLSVQFTPSAVGASLGSLSVEVEGVTSSTASFSGTGAEASFTLTVNIIGNGSVGSFSPTFSCVQSDGTCTYSFPPGTAITMKAGKGFTGWSGDCSGINNCSVTMDANRVVTATFP